MQLTFNRFKQVVARSNEKLFNKLAETVATSDNAALVAMFDDKLMLLDEENEKLFLCDYTLEKGKLSMFNFDEVGLIENDDSYLEEVVEKYFDLDDDDPVTLGELKTGFNLKFKNESKSIFTEAKDRKYRKIQESARIRAVKKVREVRNMFAEDISSLMEEPFMQWLDQKLFAPNAKEGEPVNTLNKVAFKNPYPIMVNLYEPKPAQDLITLKDNTNVMDAFKDLAGRLSDKWKSDSFRGKFASMVDKILQTESVELGKTAVLSFLDENKELFLLKPELFDELITKSALMLGDGNSEPMVDIFHKMLESKEGRLMRAQFFRANKIDETRLEEINSMIEQGETPEDMGPDEPSKDAGNDLDGEDVNKIIDIFKKIKKQLEADSPEAEYVDGLIAALDSAKVKGIDDSKMKEIIDFLSSAQSPAEKPEKGGKAPKEPDDKEMEL